MQDGRVLMQEVWYRLKRIRNPGRPCRRWTSYKLEQTIVLVLQFQKKQYEEEKEKNNNGKKRSRTDLDAVRECIL
jgi:hypothetical protein